MHAHAAKCLYTHACKYTHMYASMHMHVHASMYMHMHAHIYIYILIWKSLKSKQAISMKKKQNQIYAHVILLQVSEVN